MSACGGWREEDQEDHLVHPLLHGELEANLGYIRLCHKTKQLPEHLTEFRPTPFPSLFSQGELDWDSAGWPISEGEIKSRMPHLEPSILLIE